MSIEPRDFRHALGCFASGVCVVTTQARNGQALGVTISSFCSVSLEPPLVLFCLGKNTSNLDAYAASSCFAVNVLAESQMDLSENFARQSDDKFQGISFQKGKNGCPIFQGCVATLECKLIDTHDGGDHIIIVGRVDRLGTTQGGAPLLRYRGDYANIA